MRSALSNAPLLATKLGEELFVDRGTELGRLGEQVKRRRNVIIVGGPGIGKTSLLNRFAGSLEDAERDTESDAERSQVAVRVGGRPTDAYDFILTLISALVDVLERFGRRPALLETASDAVQKLRAAGLPTHLSASPAQSSTADLLKSLGAVRGLVDDLREINLEPVFIVDELAEAVVSREIFGRMRDELWALGGSWIVAGRPHELRILQEPPADAFFEAVIHIDPLDNAAAKRLVVTRAQAAGLPSLDDDDIAKIVSISHGVPVALLMILRQIEAGVSPGSMEAESQRLSFVSERASESAQRLLEVMRTLDRPVWATDARLLEVTGWSPSRLRQLFRELADARLIAMTDIPTSRPGRPSKGYVVERTWRGA